ncbi:MAG: hypothetical protein MZU79_09325 [Anaerotruncus sp.]|nr:hypothetical protein [Anaerotruncus sp.]
MPSAHTLERLRNEIRAERTGRIPARGSPAGTRGIGRQGDRGGHGNGRCAWHHRRPRESPAEYATALNIAAGNKLQFVVCDDDQIAADAIRYLKEERLGRVTFLPLNKLKPPDLPPLKEPGVIDYAVNLLDYDPKFDRAFAVALGGTVVVDTLDRARKLIGKYRMVTLEGELLEKSGAMTGGSHKEAGRTPGLWCCRR